MNGGNGDTQRMLQNLRNWQVCRSRLLQQVAVYFKSDFCLCHSATLSPNAHPGEIIFSGRTMASNSSFVT